VTSEKSTSSHLDTSQKGKYAFIGGIGLGIIVLLFIYFIPHSGQMIGLSIIAMALLGAKAFLLVYPRIVTLQTTSVTVKSYFLTAILIMAWVIYMAWVFQYMADNPDIIEDNVQQWVKMVVLSILTAVSMFFLSMTMARR
jgi:hypothetical protein